MTTPNPFGTADDPFGANAHTDEARRREMTPLMEMKSDPIPYMRESWRRGSLVEDGGESMYRLSAPVSWHGPNLQPDTAKLQGLLDRAGYMDLKHTEGPTGLYSFLTDEGIRDAQKANGLKEDGVVNPGGPTIRMLRAKVLKRKTDAAARRQAEFETAIHPQLQMVPMPTLPRSTVPPLPPLHKGRPPKPMGDNRPPKPLPPPETFPGTTLPPIKRGPPRILIFPDISDEINRINIVEKRRERPETKQEIDMIRKWFVGRHGWTHEAGGRDDKGKEKSEEYVPGPGAAWKDPVTGKGGDGRSGSVRPDLTMTDQNGKTIYIQHVDIDRNGKPTDQELQAAERLRRAKKYVTIFLIPKLWQMRRLRNRQRRKW